MPEGLAEYILTDHASGEIARRGISTALVSEVLQMPGQRWTVREGRDVCQAIAELGEPPALYVVRVFVDVDRTPAEVVTAYRSSKVSEYWR